MLKLTKDRIVMKKLGNKGFSAVEGLLIVVIFGIIGGVGYYVYNNRNTDVTENDSTVQTETSEAADVSESLSAEELVIKEWGVKIPKESSVAGLAYTVNDKGLFYFRSSALNKYPVGDKNCENSVYVVRGTANEKVITETSDGDETFDVVYSKATPGAVTVKVKVGSYYFIHPSVGGASCAGASTEDKDKENAARDDIVKALNTMVAT